MTCAALAAIGLHLASWHSLPGFEGVNPGAYVRTECGWQAGLYRNSEDRFTVYAGKVWDMKRLPLWGSVALATGYRELPVTPIAMAGIRVRLPGRLNLRVGYIPRIHGLNEPHVIHAAIEKEF